MKKGLNGRRSNNHTVSLTDVEWEQIKEWAAERGQSAGAWFCECALTVDPLPRKKQSRRLVLDEEEQRDLVAALMVAVEQLTPVGDGAGSVGDELRALAEGRLRVMDRAGRRSEAAGLLQHVFGEDRGAVIAAAFLSDGEKQWVWWARLRGRLPAWLQKLRRAQ